MSDTEARAAERGDDEAAALVAWSMTHDPRACPVCGWAGKGLFVGGSARPGGGLVVVAYHTKRNHQPLVGNAIRACGRCGVAYVEDEAGLSL